MTTDRSSRFDFSEMTPPPGWRLLPLSAVVVARSGNSKLIKGKQYMEPGDSRFPGYSASGQDIYCEGFEHKGDAVIISAVGARCGKCFLASGRWSAVANTHILFPQADKIVTKFLWYLVNNEEFWVKSGTAQPFVKVGKTLELPIPVPSLDQQNQIVAEIEKQFSRLDEAVVNLKRVKAHLKRYKAAVLKAAVEGRLVETEAEIARREGRSYETGTQLMQRILEIRRSEWKGKGKYKEPAAPDTTDLPELPEGWVWSFMGQAFDVYVGATPSRGKLEYWDGGIPWVSSGEVAFCRIKKTRETISPEGLANSSVRVHPVGTVLLGMIGEGKTRGQAAILDIGAGNNQNAAAIRVSETEILPDYVYSFLEKEYEDTRRRGSGGNQPALNKDRVRDIPISLPPVAEQHRIVAEVDRRFSLVREVEMQVSANIKRGERLRQSLLTQAFSGLLI